MKININSAKASSALLEDVQVMTARLIARSATTKPDDRAWYQEMLEARAAAMGVVERLNAEAGRPVENTRHDEATGFSIAIGEILLDVMVTMKAAYFALRADDLFAKEQCMQRLNALHALFIAMQESTAVVEPEKS